MNNHHVHSSNHMHGHFNTSSIKAMASTHDHHSMSKMFFHGGFVETILFEPWETISIPIFVISWIFIFIMGILYEGIKEFHRFAEEERLTKQPIFSDDAIENELARMNIESLPSTIPNRNKTSSPYSERIISSIFYIINLALGYSLMLIAMTFNVYLFFAIIFGTGVGHLLFTWSRVNPPTQRNRRS
ncbi:hypothetical protein I4U23_028536 [Adineta vaga]|nr:hypothetical protein I4U23_028536 [Adineta vaga]